MGGGREGRCDLLVHVACHNRAAALGVIKTKAWYAPTRPPLSVYTTWPRLFERKWSSADDLGGVPTGRCRVSAAAGGLAGPFGA